MHVAAGAAVAATVPAAIAAVAAALAKPAAVAVIVAAAAAATALAPPSAATALEAPPAAAAATPHKAPLEELLSSSVPYPAPRGLETRVATGATALVAVGIARATALVAVGIWAAVLRSVHIHRVTIMDVAMHEPALARSRRLHVPH